MLLGHERHSRHSGVVGTGSLGSSRYRGAEPDFFGESHIRRSLFDQLSADLTPLCTRQSPSAFPHDFNGRRESDPYPFTFFAPPQNSYSDPHVGPPPSLYHRNSYSHPPRAITGYRTLHPSSQPMSPSCSGTPSLTECSSPATSRAGSLVEGTPYFGGFATDQFDSLPRDEGAFPLPLLPPQQAAGYYDYSPRAPMPYASNTYAQYEINPHGKRTYSTEGKGDSPSRYNHLYSPTQSLTSPQAALAAFSFQSSPGSGASTPIVPQEDTMPSYDPYNPLHRAEPLSPRSVLPEGRGLAPSANLYTSNARLPKRHCPSIADDQPPGIAARRGDNPHQLHLFNLNPSPLNSPDKLSQRYPLPSPQSPYNFSPQQQHPFGYASSAPFPSPTAPDYPPRPSTASSTSASTSRPTPVAAGPPRQHQRSSSYPCDDVDACHVTPPAADFQVHEDKMPRKQKLRFEEDQYTPLWVRGQGHGKEGYGSLCPEGGKWLQLKVSRRRSPLGSWKMISDGFAFPTEQRLLVPSSVPARRELRQWSKSSLFATFESFAPELITVYSAALLLASSRDASERGWNCHTGTLPQLRRGAHPPLPHDTSLSLAKRAA